MAQGGLAHARHIFDQQMTSGQETGKGQSNLGFLAEQYFVDCSQAGVQSGAHRLSFVRRPDATGQLRPGKAKEMRGDDFVMSAPLQRSRRCACFQTMESSCRHYL